MADNNPFQTREPNIINNTNLRIPQIEAYVALAEFACDIDNENREVGIVLPVGCGKSGCITITPFAFHANRTLVVAPGVHIANQLHQDFDPSNTNMFYKKCNVLTGQPYPEPAEIRGTTTNLSDLQESDIVITNIQQLQGEQNRWLQSLPDGFFDLILFDEGHHAVAESWEILKARFPDAVIVNFSATPQRADGRLMAGRTIYSYSIFRAIQDGYVKRLKAVVLNPSTLRYIRREDGEEIQVDLEEVRQLGEQDASFRRSIVTSKETLNTIVDASIRELERLRTETGENRLKIIASALNYENCRQIVEAYRARGHRTDYVHSRQDSSANDRVMLQLENHQLDVIVQVRKLGEGFNHPLLAVAAIFNIYSNLSPFIQFVGRIMRVIEQNSPGHSLNQGVVVFHAGANIARRWSDFQEYSEADQEYFDQLLPLEGLDFSDAMELEVEPVNRRTTQQVLVRAQDDIRLEEIPLIRDDPDALEMLRFLQNKGYTPEQVREAYEQLEPIPTTKVRQRQAMRSSLDMRIRTETGRILNERGINPQGYDLDLKRLGRTNFVVLKSIIDKKVNLASDHGKGKRHELTREQLEQIDKEFVSIIDKAVQEVFGNAAD